MKSAMMTGSMVAIATPMHEDASLDYAALRSLLDWLTNCGFEYLGDAETFSVARNARVSTWTYIRKM